MSVDLNNKCGIGRDGSDALTWGRIGFFGGRPAKTFSLRPGGISKAAGSRGTTPDYIAREGNYERRNADLVAIGGRAREEMEELIVECHIGTVRKDGTVARTPILELPHELDAAAWVRICESAAAALEGRGYACMWAIHNPAKKRGRDPVLDAQLDTNPHAHFIVLARPIRDGRVLRGGGGRGKPAEAPTLWGKHTWTATGETLHPDGFMAWKTFIAEIGTAELRAAGFDMVMYPGKMRDLGIEREPERRLPAGAWFAGARCLDANAVRAKHDLEERKRRERAEERTRREAERKARAAKTLRDCGSGPYSRNLADYELLEAAGLTTLRRAEAKEVRAERRVADEEPATIKQTNYLYDLLVRKGAEIPDPDVPLTKGNVGLWCRLLEEMKDARSPSWSAMTPSEALRADIQVGASAPQQDAVRPLRVDPELPPSDRSRLVSAMLDDELLARHKATERAYKEAANRPKEKRELRFGGVALREEMGRRGIQPNKHSSPVEVSAVEPVRDFNREKPLPRKSQNKGETTL